MLNSITIRRFKNLEDVKIPLERINILVGTNNSGKSSILQGIAFAVSIAQTSKLHGEVTTLSPEQLIYTPLRDVSALAFGGDLKQSRQHAIEILFNEEVEDPQGHGIESSTSVQIRRGKNKNIALSVNDGGLKEDISSLDNQFAMYVPGLAGIPSSEPYRTPAALRKAAARGDANAVLRNILWSLKSDNDAWEVFSEHLSRVFPEIIVNPNFDPNVDEFVDVTIEKLGVKLPIDAAGTGFLQTVQILAYAAKYKPKLLLLDEPDSHIHPDKQRQLINLLSELAEKDDFQVIVATHSRHLLDVPGAYFHWMAQGSRVNIEPDESSRLRILTDLGALDSGDKLKNGNIDVVVLTEDSDQKLLKTLMASSGAEEERVQIWSYSGCTKIDAAVTLCRFIQDHAPGTEVLVHRDSDYLADEEINQMKDIFTAKNIRIFFTQGTDAESHFINAQHIRNFYPQLSELQINQAIDEATEAVREYSVKTLAKNLLREEKARRKANGDNGDPDIVALSDRARADFAARSERWRHGKKTLGQLKSKLQVTLGENLNIVRPSDTLAVEVLAEAIRAVRERRRAHQVGEQA